MQEEIIKLINQYGPLSYDAIRNFLGCTDAELASSIAPMEDNEILKIGKKYHLIDGVHLTKGIVTLKGEKKGFLRTKEESLFIPPMYLTKIFDKDEVIAEIGTDSLGRKEAHIVKNVKHTNSEIVCKCTKRKWKNYRLFQVLDPNSNYDTVLVLDNMLKGANIGDICMVEMTYKGENMTGVVSKIIGHDSDIGADVLALIAASKVPYTFSPALYDELDTIETEVSLEELKGREDFTKDKVITIDGNDSKDFDDAVSLKKLSNGNYLLSVHIADVSHYVLENTEIDQEALRRGTSIYLVDRVIPMLPEKLSNGICSLNEGIIRLVLSCIMEINSEGNIVDSRICSGYIRSLHRMTYENVNKMLNGDEKTISLYQDISEMIFLMAELSAILRKKREARGALDFDVPEMKIKVDEHGHPIDISARERDKAEMLIEDFMLSANETVAETLNHLEYPCVYRVHEDPSKEKLQNLNSVLASVQMKISHIERGVTPIQLQKIMEKIKDTDAYVAVNTLLLRAMAKARYDSRCLGHYGLAAKYYCHFTSPIRRYPDLETHRIINELIIHPTDFQKQMTHFLSVIDEICLQSSECEKKSIDLERQVDDMKAAEYMEDKIGQVYDGVISSVTSFGFFVMLPNTIEGLCHIKNLPDYYVYDEKTSTLIGNYTKDVYNIGDKVTIRVLSASKADCQIDFIVLAHQTKKGRRK